MNIAVSKFEIPTKYHCKLCKKYYTSQSSLCNHNKKFHSNSKIDNHTTDIVVSEQILKQTVEKTVEKSLGKIPKIYLCQHCDKEFESKEKLNEHLENSHSTKELIQEFPKNFLEDDKLIQLIKKNFNESDNELFKLSFNLFNQNYNTKNNFIIDLDDVYKWIGYGLKGDAKKLLLKHFVKDEDYIITLGRSPKRYLIENNKNTKGGENKETILLNIDSFKKMCMKATTKEADKIYNYYIKMEKIIFEYIQEKYKEQNNIVNSTLISLKNKDDELKLKDDELYCKDQKIKDLQYKLSNTTLFKYEEIETNQFVYALSTDVEGVYKIGESTRDITKRKKELQTSCVKDIHIVFEFKTFNSRLLEDIVHNILERYRCNSNREHFRANLDYIKSIISVAGNCLNTLKSTFQDISNEELINKTIDKLNELNK